MFTELERTKKKFFLQLFQIQNHLLDLHHMQVEVAQEKFAYRVGTWVGNPDPFQVFEWLFPT